jgi:tetratricopeptide (TPR) repeat protein
VGPCLDQYEQAIAAYRLAGNVPGLARALMEKTRVHFTLASVPYGTLVDIQPLEEITAALGDSEPELRGSIAATVSLGYWSARQPHKAEEMAQRALAIGQDLQNEPLCANAGFALGLAQYQSLQMPEALQSWQQAAASGRKADDLWLQGYALTRLPMTLAWLGQLDDAEAVAADARELIRKTHDWGNYSLTLAALASMAVIRGDFEAAEERTHETMVMVSRSRYPWGGVLALPTLAYARALRGAWAEARDAIDMLVEPGRVFEEAGPSFQADARVYRQLLQAYAAAFEDTTPHVTTHAQELIGQRPLDMSSLASFCAIVEMSDLLAAPAMAEALYHELFRAAERGVLFSPRWAFLIPRILGIAAGLNRWWDTAETHFQTAIDVATRLGARPELARSSLDYARMLAVRGSQNGRRRAIDLLRHASPILQELGMEPFMRQAAQLARGLKARIPLPSPSRTAYPAKLSEREVEILLQLAQGRTHQQIADELVLSPETITGHARRLFKRSASAARAPLQPMPLNRAWPCTLQLVRGPRARLSVRIRLAKAKWLSGRHRYRPRRPSASSS